MEGGVFRVDSKLIDGRGTEPPPVNAVRLRKRALRWAKHLDGHETVSEEPESQAANATAVGRQFASRERLRTDAES